jgi:outer membrane protein insertion porin family
VLFHVRRSKFELEQGFKRKSASSFPMVHGQANSAAMGSRREVRFVSSGVKLPSASPDPAPAPAHAILSAALPFSHIGRAIDAAARRLAASFPRFPIAWAEKAAAPLPRRHEKDGFWSGREERVLISEVYVRGKDGVPLERPELEEAAAAALRACRPSAELTAREVQEDVRRVVESGLFRSCMPVAVDTSDGIGLVFEVRFFSCSPIPFPWLIFGAEGCKICFFSVV